MAMVPSVVARLLRGGHAVIVEAGAGEKARFADDAYRSGGAEVVDNFADAGADLVAKVQPPTGPEVRALPEGSALLSFLSPLGAPEVVRALANQRVAALSLDLVPRISRAQGMDALSSQASVSGYRAALVAAERLARFFPMLMTAAGSVPPAKVLVLGAGVAGLQAIATARRLGAVVRAYDVRRAAGEEVRSLGATFVELALESQEGAGGYARAQSEGFLSRQRELIAAEVASADVVITTAAVPGRRAPVLVDASMLGAMAAGSVVVDLAAESGGNCELSVAGQELDVGGVIVYGAQHLPSTLATHASFLYARNVAEVVALVGRGGQLVLDFSDEIIDAICLTHAGEVRHGATAELLGLASVPVESQPPSASASSRSASSPSAPPPRRGGIL